MTASKYKEQKDYLNCKWEIVSLDTICELNRGVTYSKKDEVDSDGLPILRANCKETSQMIICNSINEYLKN